MIEFDNIEIINQPEGGKIGEKIKNELNKTEKYNKFYLLSAFVKKSGISRLKEDLLYFKSKEGVVKSVVGIDQGGSSKEGLTLINELSNEAYIFHSDNKGMTFHPKMYILFGNEKAIIFLGSSNLTKGGLFSNYELNYKIELNLEDKENEMFFKSNIIERFNKYSDSTRELCDELDEGLIRELKENSNYKLGTEGFSIETPPPCEGRRDGKNIFGSEPIGSIPPPFREEKSEEISQAEVSTVLLRRIPKAGGRTSQVHFTKEIMENYFGLDISEETQKLKFREYEQGEGLKDVEEHPLVYSPKNMNPKIELEGARKLSDYPEKDRPILIAEKIEKDLFYYMILLPEDEGFSETNGYLEAIENKGRGLKYDILSREFFIKIWSEYPIGNE